MVKEFYESIGGNYDEVLSRLMKEERIIKYLTKFIDADEFADFENALSNENYEEAFRLIHNIKGVSLNLGLAPLSKIASDLCEEYRHGKPEKDVSEMIKETKDTFYLMKDKIRELLNIGGNNG